MQTLSDREKVVILCHTGDIPDDVLQQLADKYWEEGM